MGLYLCVLETHIIVFLHALHVVVCVSGHCVERSYFFILHLRMIWNRRSKNACSVFQDEVATDVWIWAWPCRTKLRYLHDKRPASIIWPSVTQQAYRHWVSGVPRFFLRSRIFARRKRQYLIFRNTHRFIIIIYSFIECLLTLRFRVRAFL